jgi:hypothetical protein
MPALRGLPLLILQHGGSIQFTRSSCPYGCSNIEGLRMIAVKACVFGDHVEPEIPRFCHNSQLRALPNFAGFSRAPYAWGRMNDGDAGSSHTGAGERSERAAHAHVEFQGRAQVRENVEQALRRTEVSVSYR